MQALHLFNLSEVLGGMNVIWSRSDPNAASIVHFWSKQLPIACIAEHYEGFSVVVCAHTCSCLFRSLLRAASLLCMTWSNTLLTRHCLGVLSNEQFAWWACLWLIYGPNNCHNYDTMQIPLSILNCVSFWKKTNSSQRNMWYLTKEWVTALM